jgi:hypothetical protein
MICGWSKLKRAEATLRLRTISIPPSVLSEPRWIQSASSSNSDPLPLPSLCRFEVLLLLLVPAVPRLVTKVID